MIKQHHRGLTIHTIRTYLMWDTPVVCRPHEHRQCSNHYHRLYPTLHQGTPPPCPLWTWSPAPGESHPPRSSLELSVRGEHNVRNVYMLHNIRIYLIMQTDVKAVTIIALKNKSMLSALNQAKMLLVSHPLSTGYISKNTIGT